jgi:ABC-type nitrate/sulfonate/bicarbonate transport system permease component
MALRALAGTPAAARIAAGLAILLAWEWVVRAFAPPYVARPSTIVEVMPSVLLDPQFLAACGSTLVAIVQGLLIAIIVGTLIGLMIGRSVLAERLLRQYVDGFYAVPMIVILPLLSLWFGYSGAARLATIVFAAVFSIIINVADGARSVPRAYIEVARAFRSSRIRLMAEIILPAALPYLLAGLRLAAGRALIGAVVAEFFLAIGGLGYFILYQSRTFHHNEAFVGVLVLSAASVGFELAVKAATRRFLPWYRRDDRD